MRKDLHHVLDHATDVVGIAALTYLANQAMVTGSALPIEVVTAITTVAVGQRYAKAKWGNAYGKKVDKP
jgi:hypothetical protein